MASQTICYFVILLSVSLGYNILIIDQYKTYTLTPRSSTVTISSLDYLIEEEFINNAIIYLDENVAIGLIRPISDVIKGNNIDYNSLENQIVINDATEYSLNDTIEYKDRQYTIVGFSNNSYIEVNVNSLSPDDNIAKINIITKNIPNSKVNNSIIDEFSSEWTITTPEKLNLISLIEADIILIIILAMISLAMISIMMCFKYFIERQTKIIRINIVVGGNQPTLINCILLFLTGIGLSIALPGSILFGILDLIIFSRLENNFLVGHILQINSYLSICTIYIISIIIILLPIYKSTIKKIKVREQK